MSTILNFSVDSALLSELGEKLVESSHLALVELVKNSYDADATKVTVRFQRNAKGGPAIEIEDNGVGMNHEEVKNYWMRIATTNKVENNISKIFGLIKTGEKGIGRFCCRRLGNNLRLETVSLMGDQYQTTLVNFNWDEFIPGSEVDSIDCLGEMTTAKNGKVGTKLIISGSKRDEWKAGSFNYVKRHLSQLVANRGQKWPQGKDVDPGFNIKINAEGTLLDTKDLREEVMDAGWGTLTGAVDEKGVATYKLSALGVGEKTIKGDQEYLELKGIHFKIGIIPTTHKEQWRNKKILSKHNVSQMLEEWGGVQVRLKQFRIFPYGNDDWLDIEHDRGLNKGSVKGGLIEYAKQLKIINPIRALLSMLSMRSYLGSVEIDGDIPGFEPKASREGFLESPAVIKLKHFVRYGIDWSTIYRDYCLRQREKGEAAEKERLFLKLSGEEISDKQEVVESAVNYIESEVEKISKLLPPESKSKFKDIVRKVKTAKEAIIASSSEDKEELHHLRLIASTSTLLLIFSHEVKSLLGTLEASKNALKGILENLNKKDAATVNEVIADLGDSKTRFSELIDMTSLVGIDSKNAPERRLALREHIETAIKCFRLIVGKYEIKIDYEDVASNTLVGPMQEAELYAILLNVLSNSIKAVIAGGKDRKEIKFAAQKEAEITRISVRDNGIGLSEDHFEDVFVPFISDPDKKLYSKLKKNLNPEDRFIVGSGSGLGLSIVKELIEAKKGTIDFKKPTGKWNTHLEINLL